MIKIDQIKQFIKTYGKKITLKKHTMVFQEEELPSHFYLLESGFVKVFQQTEHGQAITLALFKPGDIFGLAEIIMQHNYRQRCAASLTEITYYAVTAEQLLNLLDEKPELWQSISRLMAQRLIYTQKFVKALTSLPVPQRLGWFLQQFALNDSEDNMMIKLPLSHEEISYLINCSRQKVTSNLNHWRLKGYITYERGKFTILQPQEIFPEL